MADYFLTPTLHPVGTPRSGVRTNGIHMSAASLLSFLDPRRFNLASLGRGDDGKKRKDDNG